MVYPVESRSIPSQWT